MVVFRCAGTANPLTAVRCRLSNTHRQFPGGRAAELHRLRGEFSDRCFSQHQHHHGCQGQQPCSVAPAPTAQMARTLLVKREYRLRHRRRICMELLWKVHHSCICPRTHDLDLFTVVFWRRYHWKDTVYKGRIFYALGGSRRDARAATA